MRQLFLFFSCWVLLTARPFAGYAQLFGDIAKKPDEKTGGFSLSAHLGFSVGLPSTDAKYDYVTYYGSNHAYEISGTSTASPGSYLTLPVDIAACYQFGYHFRLGLGVKSLGLKLETGNADQGVVSYSISGRATVPFVEAGVNFSSSKKGSLGVGLQIGKPSVGGDFSNTSGGAYFGLPLFYEVPLNPKLSLSFLFDSYMWGFNHNNWLGTTEQVHSSVLGLGLSVGLRYHL